MLHIPSRTEFFNSRQNYSPTPTPKKVESIRFSSGMTFTIRPQQTGAMVFSLDPMPATAAPLMARLSPQEYDLYLRLPFIDRKLLMAVLVAETESSIHAKKLTSWGDIANIHPRKH